MSDNTEQPGEPRSFEGDMQALEHIVRGLEGGQLPLEKALALYREGYDIYNRCQKTLEKAQTTVQDIQVKAG